MFSFLNKKDQPKKRFFIVYWEGFYKTGGSFVGNNDKITNGEFIDRDDFIFEVKKRFVTFKSVTITNIQELTEQDYNTWKGNR